MNQAVQIQTRVVEGAAAGPHLLITGGVHGDEFESMVAIRRLMTAIDPRQLRGRVTLAPVVNQAAFLRGHRTAEDNLDLARTCPGRPDGSITERIAFPDSDVAAHIWRFLYDTARQYRESFDVYGSKKSFEWTLVEGESHVMHTAKRPEPEIPQRVVVPDFAHLLPEEIRPFTRSIVDADHLSFLQGSGHGGSHPHLVNGFVSALVEESDPWPIATTSANWTCVGILAHESALAGDEIWRLPEFTRKR